MTNKVSVGAIACAIAMAVACGEDEALGPGTGGAAGAAGSGASAGSGGDGGGTGGGSGSGGSSGAGGSSGGAAGNGASAGADSGTGGADGGPPKGRLLVAGTDFFSKTEIATVDLATNKVSGSVTLNDGDAVPAASSGQAFVLERTNAKLHHLDAAGQILKSIDVGKAALGLTGSGSTNPVGVVATGTGSSARAHVLLQTVNRMAVLDLAAGTVTKTIDLAAYQASGDADGSVDMTSPVLHPSSGRVYFLLGRIDRTTVAAPSYQLACPSVKALLVAVDTANDSIVDLNGSAAGEGIELALANPVDLALDAAQDRLLVLSAGCFAPTEGGSTRVGHGVESVALGSFATSTKYAAPNQDFLSRLLLRSSGAALLNSFDPSFAEHWYPWATATTALGSELGGVPAAPSLEDEGHLLGASVATTDAGSTVDVVRYDIGAQSKSTLVASPWTGSFSSVAGTALVR